MARSARRSYKDLSLQQLRSFCEVCRRGGYAAAARELHLTSPAVWEQMQALEGHYGVRLLERRSHSVQPTMEGKHLLEMIRPLLAGLDSAKEVLQQQDGALPKELTLATNLRVLTEEVSRGLRQFQGRYAQIRLRVFYTGNDVEQRILSSEADVGFTLEPGPDIPCSTAVVYEPAGEVDYLLVTPPRHPLLRQRALQLRHVIQYPLVLGEPAAYSRRRVQEILHRDHPPQAVRVVVETSSDEYTLSCVRAGMGVGITVGTGHGHLYRGLGVRSLRRWFGTARVGFLWKRGAHVPPAQRALAQAIQGNVARGARENK
ncbi:MAG: LysR family transcriptional regulator [Acidobacteria bacterium]|nr:LysR family transcriptional regulator [Acidobacteriota bacterium]MCI0723301.1 LysR family transcriptional regulator [Acidobacteriota bacterium]